jgi:hypothetical protein
VGAATARRCLLSDLLDALVLKIREGGRGQRALVFDNVWLVLASP